MSGTPSQPDLNSRFSPDRCPLCGGPNDCGVAQGKDQCWCFTANISPEALAPLPEEARGKICICARCAQRGAALALAPKSDKK
jgi:Cysteine-rich CWC